MSMTGLSFSYMDFMIMPVSRRKKFFQLAQKHNDREQKEMDKIKAKHR